jgi:hypothetical protein
LKCPVSLRNIPFSGESGNENRRKIRSRRWQARLQGNETQDQGQSIEKNIFKQKGEH